MSCHFSSARIPSLQGSVRIYSDPISYSFPTPKTHCTVTQGFQSPLFFTPSLSISFTFLFKLKLENFLSTLVSLQLSQVVCFTSTHSMLPTMEVWQIFLISFFRPLFLPIPFINKNGRKKNLLKIHEKNFCQPFLFLLAIMHITQHFLSFIDCFSITIILIVFLPAFLMLSVNTINNPNMTFQFLNLLYSDDLDLSLPQHIFPELDAKFYYQQLKPLCDLNGTSTCLNLSDFSSSYSLEPHSTIFLHGQKL